MAASNGTVVALVGDESPELISSLAALRNVEAFTVKNTDEAEAARRIVSSPASYVISDADPLAHVAAAWVEFFDDRVSFDTLLLEVETAATALASGDVSMPDYYLVLEPEAIEGTWRHWWFGALSRKAPTRVLPMPASSAQIRRQLRRLPTGRPWEHLDEWLRALPFEVPDRVI